MRCIVMVIVFCFAYPTGADTFYSYDMASNRLVTVNTTNGDVTPISPLTGIGLTIMQEVVDLTYANGFIYGLESGSSFSSPSRLFRINVQNGLVQELPKILQRPNGEFTDAADAIATNASGQLVVSYRALSPDDNFCDAIGIVNPNNGVISHEHSFFTGSPGTMDFDAMATDFNGTLWAMDNGAGGGQRNFIRLTMDPPTAVIVGTIPDSVSSSNDIAFGETGLFAVRASGSIQKLNPVTGANIGSTFYDAGYNLVGLAYIPVPGPGGIGLALMATIMGYRRRRQH